MFGTGAFARVAQVSVRTLHHYDDVGLLPPAQVDPQTGYRWYRADQLQRLNRILALRDLGLPLTEVRKVVDDEVSLDELRGMLRLRKAEARDHMAVEAERLSRVEARLRQIETEGRVGDYDVVVKPLEPQHVALVDTTAPAFGNATLGPIFGRLFGELYGELDRVGVAPAGPQLALYEPSDDRPAHQGDGCRADRRRPGSDHGWHPSRRPSRRWPGGSHDPPWLDGERRGGVPGVTPLGGGHERAGRRLQPRGVPRGAAAIPRPG